ncbi:MAG: FemAB family protein [Aquaticitalea sp.]
MNEFKIIKYSPIYTALWNDFVSTSKNATFLFHRDFMEYHQDRFEDFSLMVFKDEKLMALLPANKVGNEIYSHQGLTYGGLAIDHNSFDDVKEIFDAIIAHLKELDVYQIHLKLIPDFYSEPASNELAYLLFANNANLDKRDMVLVIDLQKPINFHKTKLKHFKKSQNAGLKIRATTNFGEFWNDVLEPRLKEKYQTKPVHSLEEIELLNSKFPNNILQFDVLFEDEIVAGITLFKTKNVVKSQYGATTLKGEKLRALEFLFMTLIEQFKSEGMRYFSMGTVYESNELGYNKGLLKQKEELGCSVYIQDFYKMKIK